MNEQLFDVLFVLFSFLTPLLLSLCFFDSVNKSQQNCENYVQATRSGSGKVRSRLPAAVNSFVRICHVHTHHQLACAGNVVGWQVLVFLFVLQLSNREESLPESWHAVVCSCPGLQEYFLCLLKGSCCRAVRYDAVRYDGFSGHLHALSNCLLGWLEPTTARIPPLRVLQHQVTS